MAPGADTSGNSLFRAPDLSGCLPAPRLRQEISRNTLRRFNLSLKVYDDTCLNPNVVPTFNWDSVNAAGVFSQFGAIQIGMQTNLAAYQFESCPDSADGENRKIEQACPRQKRHRLPEQRKK
jgi:hypothetical protein